MRLKAISGTCIVVALSIGLASCSQPPPENPPASNVVAQNAPADLASSHTLEEASKLADQIYLVRPDNRFLKAASIIVQTLTPGADSNTECNLINGEWEVRCGSRTIGKLAALFTFNNGLSLLSDLCKQIIAEKKLAITASTAADPSLPSRFLEPRYLETLKQLNNSWKPGVIDPGLVGTCRECLTNLAVSTLDEIGASDEIAARALAMTALGNAVGQSNVCDQAVIASVMGYNKDGLSILNSRSDAGSKATAAWIRQSFDEMPPASQLTNVREKYLYLMLGCKAHFDNAQLDTLEKTLSKNQDRSLALLKCDFNGKVFWERFEVCTQIADLTMSQIERKKSTLEELVSKLGVAGYLQKLLQTYTTPVAQFEQASSALDFPATAPVITKSLAQSYYGSYFYSCIYLLGLHLLDSLSSREAAETFSRSLGETSAPAAREIRTWFEHLTMAGNGVTTTELASDLSGLKCLGVPPLMRTFKEIGELSPFGDPALLQAARTLTSRLDTRPEHRMYLATIAYKNLLDLAHAEKFYASALDCSANTDRSLYAWYLGWTSQTKRLYELLKESHLSPAASLTILDFLKADKSGVMPASKLEAEYARIARSSTEWYPTKKYVEYLSSLKKYALAVAVAQKWYDSHENFEGLSGVAAQNSIASNLFHLGKLNEALKVATEAALSGQSQALGWKSRILDKLGKTELAEQLAKENAERYSDSVYAVCELATFYWRHGRYSDAASAFKEHKHPISATEWKFEIAPAFCEIFGKDEGKVVEAINALTSAGFQPTLTVAQLAANYHLDGNDQMAFVIESRLQGRGMESFELATTAYRYLTATEGEAEALKWLKERVPAGSENIVSMFAFGSDQPKLLWTLIPAEPSGQGADFVWLMRAATLDKADKAQRSKVEAYYGNGSNSTGYDTIARYLLGKVTDADYEKMQLSSSKELCERSFYRGLKEQNRGKLVNAAKWFTLCTQVGSPRDGEYRWAYDRLFIWRNDGRQLKNTQK